MSIDLFDESGAPVAYTEDGQHLFLFTGEPVAYIEGDSIYSFEGRHLGWFDDGLIRDHNGDTVLFSPHSRGGPLKPLRQLIPLKALRELMPLKSLREMRPARTVNSMDWSSLNPLAFFRI
jgi:hypothetical protein